MAEVTALRNNALPYPVYGVPWTVVFPLLDADGDPVTGATCDSEVSLNGDTGADCTNEGTEITFTTSTNKGMYYLTLTAAEMTADVVTVTIYSATSKATCIVLYPRKLVELRSGTSAGGDTAYITLDASAGAVDDTWNGCLCVATIDGNVEARVIADYTGSNQRAAVTPAWNVAPDADDTFKIYLPEGRQFPNVNVTHLAMTAQTGRDIGASVLLSPGTGTGQLDFTSGVVKANVTQIAGQTASAAAGVTFPASIGTSTYAGADTAGTTELLTRIPDATAGTNGGLPTVDANNRIAGIQGTKNDFDDLNDIAAGAEMDLVDAPNATAIAAIQSGLSTLTAQQVWEYATRTLSSFGSTVSDVATAVWGAATRTLTAFSFTVTAGTVSDKTGYSLASSQTFNVTGNITGNLSGSVGSVTGNVGGSVASVTAAVTTANAADVTAIKAVTDKLDDTLEDDGGTYRFTENALEQAPAGGASLTAQDVRDAMKLAPSAGDPAAGSIDTHLDDAATDVWSAATRTLTATQTFDLAGDITGNLSGSVGSVTGNVGGSVASVTGAVGSVTGNVGGNVTGSVGSVVAAVTPDNAADTTEILAISDKLDTAMEADGDDYRFTSNALEEGPTGSGGGVICGTSSVTPSLEETVYLDFIVSSPTTAAAVDADSAPAYAVYEDATDTAIVSGVATKRTSLTGHYRVGIACTTANGYEAGKSYHVVVSATVEGTAGYKGVIGGFVMRARNADALAPSSTALSNATWTNARAAKLDNLDVAVSSRSTLAAGAEMALTSDYNKAKTAATAQEVWEYATRTVTGLGTLGASIAAAVWASATRTLTAFGFTVTAGTVSDKTGYSLTSAYDPAKTAAQDATVAKAATSLSTAQWTNGRAAKLDYLDAYVSSASATSFIDGGSDSCTLTLTDGDDDPISGADVYVTSDAGGTKIIDPGTLTTNASGQVTFDLTAGVTYYRWASKDGWTFTNPKRFVAVADT